MCSFDRGFDMKRIRGAISLVPGPTQVPRDVLELYKLPYGSPDLDEAFFVTYKECTERLAGLLDACEGGSAALLSGEAMAALWGAVRSAVRPGERVAALSNGLFGAGMAGMAASSGAHVALIESDWRRPLDVDRLRHHLETTPDVRLVTAVHCETPRYLKQTKQTKKKKKHRFFFFFFFFFLKKVG